MKTLTEIRKDLQAHSSFFNMLSAKVFNRHASLDEVMQWVKENPAEFEAYSGVKVGKIKESKVLTREDAKAVKAHLLTYSRPGRISVCRRGKYHLEIQAFDFTSEQLRGMLKECGYNLTRSLEGQFGAGVDWLLHIARPV